MDLTTAARHETEIQHTLRYSATAQWLHWITALLILATIPIAWQMVEMKPGIPCTNSLLYRAQVDWRDHPAAGRGASYLAQPASCASNPTRLAALGGTDGKDQPHFALCAATGHAGQRLSSLRHGWAWDQLSRLAQSAKPATGRFSIAAGIGSSSRVAMAAICAGRAARARHRVACGGPARRRAGPDAAAANQSNLTCAPPMLYASRFGSSFFRQKDCLA